MMSSRLSSASAPSDAICICTFEPQPTHPCAPNTAMHQQSTPHLLGDALQHLGCDDGGRQRRQVAAGNLRDDRLQAYAGNVSQLVLPDCQHLGAKRGWSAPQAQYACIYITHHKSSLLSTTCRCTADTHTRNVDAAAAAADATAACLACHDASAAFSKCHCWSMDCLYPAEPMVLRRPPLPSPQPSGRFAGTSTLC